MDAPVGPGDLGLQRRVVRLHVRRELEVGLGVLLFCVLDVYICPWGEMVGLGVLFLHWVSRADGRMRWAEAVDLTLFLVRRCRRLALYTPRQATHPQTKTSHHHSITGTTRLVPAVDQCLRGQLRHAPQQRLHHCWTLFIWIHMVFERVGD